MAIFKNALYENEAIPPTTCFIVSESLAALYALCVNVPTLGET